MAIKFDELLEALDSSLDEDFNDMWIIIPTEKRYDLIPSDYLKFARQYGTFDNKGDCFDKIEELAPDRWDAFIPMKLEGINESLILKESVSQSKSEELYDFLSEIGIKTQDAIDQIPNIDLEELCEYFECDDTIEFPSDLIDILGLDADDILEVILDLISDKDINEYINTVNEYLDESLNESKSSEALLTEIGNRIASGLRQEGFDSSFDYPGLSVMNTSYGIHIVNMPSISVEDENGKQVLTAPINTHDNSTEAVSKIVKIISKSMRK